MNPFILLGIAGVGVWYFTRPSPVVPEGGVNDATSKATGMTLATGLRLAHNGIKVNQRQTIWLIALRKACSIVIVPEIVCTSGIRSYESQTAAMLTYLDTFGEAKFKSLYKTAATELLATQPQTGSAWLPVVKSLYERDILHKSGHITGGAVDVRHKGLTAEQRKELERAAKQAKATKFYDDGPAYHADIPELA